MAITSNATTLTFNDATTQTTSAVTSVTAGTGISVAGGKTPTVTNTGVTSVTAGSGISVSASTGGVTITSTGGSGTVTSVATGNGLSGGTITSSGTLTVACPTFNTVGSYCFIGWFRGPNPPFGITSGSNYSGGGGYNNVRSIAYDVNSQSQRNTNNLSGTWKWMASTGDVDNSDSFMMGVGCRVS